MMFQISSASISALQICNEVSSKSVGAVATFEGRIRNHNEGKQVVGLEYDIYPELAVSEGNKIVEEARQKFPVEEIIAVHRYGKLELGEVAVAVVVSSSHRDEAFAACRFVIDEVKLRVPIWKKEFYASGHTEWVGCPKCRAKNKVPHECHS